MNDGDDYAEFERLYQQGENQIVWERVVADLETTVSTYLKLSADKKNTFLLESVEGGAKKGRFSMIGCDPDVILRIQGGEAEVNRQAHIDPNGFEAVDGKPLDVLRGLVQESQVSLPDGVPAQSAGIYGYLGYEMVRQMEVLPDENETSLETPDSILMRPRLLVIFDTLKDELYFTAPVYPAEGVSARQAYEGAHARLEEALAALENPISRAVDEFDLDEIEVTSNTSEAEYHDMVQRAKKYIRAGDIFQVVLSQRFSCDFTLPATSLYRALRRTNPSPYMYLLEFDGFSVVGSSPEILVRVDQGEVTIRPIAGTRKRGATPERDQAMADELLNDPKELSEHLMLLDLGRNDVGRVAKIGSVEVTDQFFLEYYSHVMHIVSNVIGELDAEKYDYVDALAGGFPAGTVSGAPKVRAMEIIDELEKTRRGIYGGCVGYFGADGYMDTCIVLRTAILKDEKLYVQAGAGIVADSQPKLEQLECINKAKALFSAAEEALRFAGEAKRGQ